EHLDAARLQAATLVGGKLDVAGVERMYAAAFAEAGLRREGDDVEALAARVRDSAGGGEGVAGPGGWGSIPPDGAPGGGAGGARRGGVVGAARRADPDPTRDRLRQPELWRDGARLTGVVQEVRVAELSPQLATALGRVLRARGGEAVPLLSAAQARCPNDFWL